MGYSENSCQICAVSINIARARLLHEPKEAGWGYSGGLYYSSDEESSRCSLLKEKSGCKNVKNEYAGSDFLHIPGRGCCFQGAYSGLRIGADEMKGMNLPRYIVQKPMDGDFEKEEQQDYERKSDYFVTSQTITPPDDFEPGELAKVRFGIDNFFPQNYSVLDDDDQDCGVPIHESCWKIFERVSKMRLGEVDLQGFMALWRRQACGNCGFQNLKQDQIILKCREQFWTHIPGTEYLAANPHDIPGFPTFLAEHYSEHPKGDGVFWLQDMPQGAHRPVYENPTDVFVKIPAELKNLVLNHLGSKDVASLRLASRSFRQLPKTLFKRLMYDELPWFWEYDVLDREDLECMLQEGQDMKVKDKQVTKSINWLEIYKQICVARKGILGLRNRARVWYLVEEIVGRIGELRSRFCLDGGELKVEPSEDEENAGLVKHGLYCPRCEICQIQGRGGCRDEAEEDG